MPSSSGKMHPALDYLNASIDLAQTLISEHALQFGGVVDRIQADDYDLSDLSKDLLRFWANGWSGWGRLFSQPHSMFMARRGLVPTLVFLIDSSAEAAGPKTVELPVALETDSSLCATRLEVVGQNAFIANTFVQSRRCDKHTIEVSLSNLTEARSRLRAALGRQSKQSINGHLVGVIYEASGQQRKVVALVNVVLDIEANEDPSGRIIPEAPDGSAPTAVPGTPTFTTVTSAQAPATVSKAPVAVQKKKRARPAAKKPRKTKASRARGTRAVS